MVKFAPRVSYLRVGPGDLHPGLIPVPAALLLAGQASLCPPEFLLCPPQELREAIFRPSDSTAKWVRPKSMPITGPVPDKVTGPVSMTKLAKYRPAESGSR